MRSPNPPILMINDDSKDEAQVLHILSKYHFSNPTFRIGNFREAMNFFNPSLAEVKSMGAMPELILLSLNEMKAQKEVAAASRRNEWKETPLIVVVNSADEGESFRKLNLPNSYCICKPIGFFKLLEAMQRLGMYWMVLRAPLESRNS